MYSHLFKRVIDFTFVFIVLLLIWWLLVIIAIGLHFVNKGAGAFFFQKRPGKNGKIFNVIKFKSMTDEKDVNGNLLPDAQRLTKVGRFVRATSIDELPQLINWPETPFGRISSLLYRTRAHASFSKTRYYRLYASTW